MLMLDSIKGNLVCDKCTTSRTYTLTCTDLTCEDLRDPEILDVMYENVEIGDDRAENWYFDRLSGETYCPKCKSGFE